MWTDFHFIVIHVPFERWGEFHWVWTVQNDREINLGAWVVVSAESIQHFIIIDQFESIERDLRSQLKHSLGVLGPRLGHISFSMDIFRCDLLVQKVNLTFWCIHFIHVFFFECRWAWKMTGHNIKKHGNFVKSHFWNAKRSINERLMICAVPLNCQPLWHAALSH